MYKRILTVQDISCLGQCSMTVALPILSAWGHETCILPTAILSTHTGGFSKPAVHHLGASVRDIREHWRRERITFDAIYTGYLGSAQAVRDVLELKELLAPGGLLIVDPAMADHGKVYAGLDDDCVQAMLELCRRADILLPNVTEAAMLSGMPYQQEITPEYVNALMKTIPCNKVILTGIGFQEGETGICVQENGVHAHYAHRKIGKNYHGTGDIFASCFVGAYVSGFSLAVSAQIAAQFTCRAIEETFVNPAHSYGVKFETVLPELWKYRK